MPKMQLLWMLRILLFLFCLRINKIRQVKDECLDVVNTCYDEKTANDDELNLSDKNMNDT